VTKKISKTIIGISVMTLVVSMALIMAVLYNYFIKEHVKQQGEEMEIISQIILHGDIRWLEEINTNSNRITWIASDGTVLFDNMVDISEMENHLDREEIREALADGRGESLRYSNTLSKRTIYTTKRLADGTVLRLSTTQISMLFLVINVLRPIMFTVAICILFSIIVARKLAKRIVEPINRLNLETPIENEIYDEFSPLLLRIEKQNKKIEKQIYELNEKSQEIIYFTERVSDAIIVLDDKGMVLVANKKAKELLNCEENRYYLDYFHDLKYRNMVEKALKGNSNSCSIKIGERVFGFSASTNQLSGEKSSVFLFIRDITDEEMAQEMRRQFTANVSHELKTPLTSIMGSAEIMSQGIIKSEDIPYFSNRIYEESARLLALIQDIIKISRLDEGKVEQNTTMVPLLELCKQVQKQLKEKAEKHSISIEVKGEEHSVNGVLHILHEMVYNLCDNAIAYNKENGKVILTVEKKANIVLSVADTGIGIGTDDIARIFERFYRVDKSHNKESGGTGLGLSIVKNGALLHNAQVLVESKVGEGSKFLIEFPG
jgi:Signal transduction histidine kinase